MENKIIIAGGSGFIGRALIKHFSNKNYPVVVLSRRLYKSEPMIRYVNWDGKKLGKWSHELEGARAIINLTGKSINCRFTEENKKEILSSRVNSVKVLSKAIANCEVKPSVWLQASSIGFYGNTTEPCDENFEAGKGFLAMVTNKWEETFLNINLNETRKITLRIGIVLGKNGGALSTLNKVTKLFLGGSAGNGKQMMSWIHINDLVSIIDAVIENSNFKGIYNAVSPTSVTNEFFMKTLRKACKRPWSPPVPEFVLKIVTKILGTEASLILDSSNIIPRKLLNEKFVFKYPKLEQALSDLC